MTGQFRRAPTATLVLFALTAWIADIASAETIRVEVKGLAFAPAQITVHLGDTIEWVNDDFVAHTATARDGQWDVKLPPHATGRAVVTSAVDVSYYCRYHPTMKGEITVARQ
jgi:plastocyanin